MVSLVLLLTFLLNIYIYMIIAVILINWMVLFGVMNMRNKAVHETHYYLNLATEPAFKKIRQVVPSIGGMDFSPIVLLIGINIVKGMLHSIL